MRVSELLESRRPNWRELEHLCNAMKGRSRRRLPAAMVARFSALYRSACADLALADAHQLPPDMVEYLHQLVGKAHNQLYRSNTFQVSGWRDRLLIEVPRRLFADNCLRLAFCIFWGMFLLSATMAYYSPEFAEAVIKKEGMLQVEENFSKPVWEHPPETRAIMVGFYVYNNGSVGLRCFAFGLLFGIGGLFETAFNASLIGATFGYMATVPQQDNFFEFVTAHGPFELTAIVLMAAAGMRLGFSLVDTKGLARTASLRHAANEAVPTMCAAILMFVLAAFIEAFISPSAIPYAVKATVAVASTAVLMVYFVFLGYPQKE